jgi:cytochrome c biogenesis protein CcmG/thiol:disulfide interchange protein DsbE
MSTTSRYLSLLPLLLLLALATYFAFGLTRDPHTIQSVLIDKPLPAFDLPAFGREGESVKSGDLKGKVSLLNIFASWCVACRAEHPVLLELKKGRIAIYGLAWKDKPEELTPWLAELGNPYTAIADDRLGRTAIDLGVTGAPETYVIDKQGRIRFKQVGPIDQQVWENTLAPLVKQLESER